MQYSILMRVLIPHISFVNITVLSKDGRPVAKCDP